LGRIDFFRRSFGLLKKALDDHGVKKVLVACPSCYRVWSDYGDNIEVQTVYEKLVEGQPLRKVNKEKTVTVHDPCATRHDTGIHASVRQLIKSMGIRVREMKHHGPKTVCCGEGGATCYIVPQYAGSWTALRADEAEGDYIITYCAGCTNFLGRLSQTDHVLDLICEPEKTLSGKTVISRSPITWVRRFLLKRKLLRLVRPVLTGKRDGHSRVVFRKNSV